MHLLATERASFCGVLLNVLVVLFLDIATEAYSKRWCMPKCIEAVPAEDLNPGDRHANLPL
jgi:hypothetical protein